jgi:hypothetical protein
MILTFLSLNMIFIQFVPPFLAVNKYLYFYVILFLMFFQMLNYLAGRCQKHKLVLLDLLVQI